MWWLLPPALAEPRVPDADLPVYTAPRTGAPYRGTLAAGESFEVITRVDAPGCPGEGWGEVAAHGFVCLAHTRPADTPPAPLPRVLFGDSPYVYGRRTSTRSGPVYASAEAYERGAAPLFHLLPDASYHFVGTATTTRGEVLLREDGRVVPTGTLRGYSPSPFRGRDFLADPLPAGRTLGWCVERHGCLTTGGVALAFQASFYVEETTFEGAPRARIWAPPPIPEGVGADDLWVDVDRTTQTLTVSRGASAIRATLVSTGLGARHQTPVGTFRVQDKRVSNDMRSREGASEPYSVEEVPWVVHIQPRIALHGAFWHGRFGWPMSHGCINLSPGDARDVFALLSPALPDGWQAVYATVEDPGTIVRVR